MEFPMVDCIRSTAYEDWRLKDIKYIGTHSPYFLSILSVLVCMYLLQSIIPLPYNAILGRQISKQHDDIDVRTKVDDISNIPNMMT